MMSTWQSVDALVRIATFVNNYHNRKPIFSSMLSRKILHSWTLHSCFLQFGPEFSHLTHLGYHMIRLSQKAAGVSTLVTVSKHEYYM